MDHLERVSRALSTECWNSSSQAINKIHHSKTRLIFFRSHSRINLSQIQTLLKFSDRTCRSCGNMLPDCKLWQGAPWLECKCCTSIRSSALVTISFSWRQNAYHPSNSPAQTEGEVYSLGTDWPAHRYPCFGQPISQTSSKTSGFYPT
jgi:hypothetical protein